MRIIIGTLLSIILISCYSFAEQLGIPDFGDGEGRILYAQTEIDSKDHEIGIKRYSDPSVFPMIGWRGMIIVTDDGDSTYYVKISNFENDLISPPNFNPGGDVRSPIRLHDNLYAEGQSDRKAYRVDPNLLDRWYENYNMDFDLTKNFSSLELPYAIIPVDKYSIIQKFSEGTSANQHYAFIPSRPKHGTRYREVIESPLHRSGVTIYYRWWREEIRNGETVLVGGNIHSFINPRKISIAMFGDSFGSGEGAPDRNSQRPWIHKRQDEQHWGPMREPSTLLGIGMPWSWDFPPHRSINSGFELALKQWITKYPDFAINFGNYSWSGAIAYLPPINHNERYESDRIEEEKYKGPKTMWGQLTQLNRRGPNTTNDSKTIDALFINMGGNDAGFGDIIAEHLSPPCIRDFDIRTDEIEGRMFNDGEESWMNIFDRTLRVWSDFFNGNFNGDGEPNYAPNFKHVEGSTININNIHEIAWFNYPDVTAGSPNRVLDNLGLISDCDDFSLSEFSRIKPLIIDVLNQKMRDNLGERETKITLYEHPEEVTGGLGIPYKYDGNDILRNITIPWRLIQVPYAAAKRLGWEDFEISANLIPFISEDLIIGVNSITEGQNYEFSITGLKEYHSPFEYARIDGDEEHTDPNRWYNHFFYYRGQFEMNDDGLDLKAPIMMGSFHPNENGYRNAYLPLYNQAFGDKLSYATLRQRAIEEGVSTYSDLVGEPLSITASKDQETNSYNISGQFKVKNLTDVLVENNFNVQLILKSSKMEYQNGRPVPVGSPTDVNIEIEPIVISPENLDNPQDFTISINSFNNTSSEFHSFIGRKVVPIDPFTAFLRIHIPQRYTVLGYVDPVELRSWGNIQEGIGESNNSFIIGEVYPDPAYDPKLQESLRDQSRQFEIELRGLVKEAGGNLPDSTVEELDPEWLENLINRAFGEAQIKDRMEELTGFRKPDGKIENRAFEDEMVIPISEMYRMADFAKALSDREKGIEILSSMKGAIPLINEDLAFDEIRFSHVKNQEVHGIANFADALAECRYLMDEMEFTYFKYSQNEDGLPEYKAYKMKLDTGVLFRGIRAEMDDKDNLVVFIDPNELPDEIAKGPIQIKLAFDDPGQFISSIEREGIIEKTTIVIPKEDWLGDKVQDGRGILVDVSVQKTANYYGAEIPIWSSLAGYRVPTKSQFPSVELPLIEDFGEPDPVNVFKWQSPKEGINPDWTHARLQIKSGSKILLEEIADYGDQKISFEKMYQNLAGYGVNLTVDFELGNKDFSISSGVKSYPFHYPYKVPLIKPVLSWNPPQEWSEGLALTSEIQNANASYNGKELEGNFEYSFEAGDQLRSGNQVLQATFIPNSPEYATSVVSRLISVKPSLSLVVKEDPFRFEFGSIIDQEYQIEVSEDLKDWKTISTVTANSNITTYEPVIKNTQKRKFFRVKIK